MSSGSETRFIASVQRHLPPPDEFHREKMANPYRGGTADSWYSGSEADLWIEWKFIDVPKRDGTIIDLIGGKKPMISVLQQHWIRNRLLEGREVWTIVGCKEGGVIYKDCGWAAPLTAADFLARVETRPYIAQQILDWCR